MAQILRNSLDILVDKYKTLLYLKKHHKVYKKVLHNILQILVKKKLESVHFSRDFFGLAEMC